MLVQVSPVPRLLGHFPLNISLCLRALSLHYAVEFAPGGTTGKQFKRAATDLAPRALDALVAMFQRPFYAEQDPALLQKMQHLFRCTAQHSVPPCMFNRTPFT